MKKTKVLFTLFIVIFSLTKGPAQNLLAFAQANQEYDLFHANSKVNKVRTKVNGIINTYPDRPKFYTDSTKWTIRFTSLNTDSDDFGPTYFKDGLIITSNRYPKQTKYSSGSKTNSFTDLYFIKDTNSIKKVSLQGETNKPLNVMAMTRRKTMRPDVNNNTKIGNFYVKSSVEIPEISEAELTPATLQKGALKSKLNDGPLSFPADESWVMFTRNRDANRLQLFSASYTNEKWINIESFIYNSNAYSTGHPSLSADGKTLYFVSNMPGGYGGTDIYYCLRAGDSWTKPVNLGNKINTGGDEMFPFLDSQNNLYFSSDGLPGLGGLDIFHILLKEYLPSGEAKNLGYPLNSNKDDFGIITANNGSSGYFSSDRRGNDDIYRFDRETIAKAGETLAGTVKDSIGSAIRPIVKMPVAGTDISSKENTQGSAVIAGKPVSPVAKPVTELIKPLSEPVASVTETVKRKTEPVRPAPQPVTSVTETVKPKTQPVRPAAQPVASVAEPVKSKVEPVRPTAQPVPSVADPVNGSRISIAENISTITTISASDADAGTRFSYSLNGGVDMAKFRINSNTGALTFITAPDFEKPSDSDGNNAYIAVLRASDGTNITDLTIIVSITDVNDNAPIITSNAAVSVPENAGTVTAIKATDADAGTTLNYTLSGGADVAKFLINSSSGALTLISTPDFERPTDADNNNNYITVVRVSDGTNTADQTVVVTITDINDSAPVITSNAAFSIPENTTAITRITAIDADAGATFTYSLSGGADVAKFSINSSSGALIFISEPDFEKPSDADANNTYTAIVRASDGINTTDQAVVINVTDVNDNTPIITSVSAVSIPENTTDVSTVTTIDTDAGSTFSYSLSGGTDVVKFRINSSSGGLTFISAPDFEKPVDAGANNTYNVMVRANDGAKTSDQAVSVTITDVNDNIPVITSNATISVSENGTVVTTVRTTDADAGSIFSYSLSGGADAALFTIDSSSGVLTFISTPDYEKPGDTDANNKYIVVIRASDGANNADQTIIVTVTDINDNAPVIKLN